MFFLHLGCSQIAPSISQPFQELNPAVRPGISQQYASSSSLLHVVDLGGKKKRSAHDQKSGDDTHHC